VIAAIVATVILPVSTYSVIHTGLHGYLQSLPHVSWTTSAGI